MSPCTDIRRSVFPESVILKIWIPFIKMSKKLFKIHFKDIVCLDTVSKIFPNTS